MQKKSDKITFKEALTIHFECMKELNKKSPNIFLSAALSSAMTAIFPFLTIFFSARIIDELAGERRVDVLWMWVIITIIVTAIATLLKTLCVRWNSFKYLSYFKMGMYNFTEKMFSMDFADIDKQEIHDLRSQIAQSSNWNGWGYLKLYHTFQDAVSAVIGIISAIALTVTLFTIRVPESAGRLTVLNNPIFILILAVLLFAITLSSSALANKSGSYWVSMAEQAKLGNRLFSTFGFIAGQQKRAMDLRVYNQQDISAKYMKREKIFGLTSILQRYSRGRMGLCTSTSEAIAAISTGVVYVFVCLKAWAGAFGVGSVTQYVGAVTTLAQNVSMLVKALGTLRSNTPFMRDINRFLSIPNSMYQGSLTTEKRSDREYDVEFRNVSFKYPGSELWALKDVSVKFKVGNRLAVVGENGSGKTTFIKLLCRLYDPQEGEILLNGINIKKYRYDDYMGVFSVVFQDFQLISQPLGMNVAGRMEYDHDRVIQSLRDAGFEDRLNEMPDGLDTMLYKDLEESGVDVSGGEAQKIAIARALYKNAPFIVLDEPTAALDPIAEAEIYSKFNDIVGDKTAIYISHRLSSCKFCDEIMVFHEGSVVQTGTHDELLADESGKYSELWNAQAQYYVKKEE